MSNAVTSVKPGAGRLRRFRSPRSRAVTALVIGVLALAYTPFAASVSTLTQLQQVMYFAVAVLSVSLLTGRLGQLSLGQGAFMGIGAYTTALCVSRYELSWWIGLIAAVGLCAVLGAVAGLPSLRISGLNLALVTLGIATVFPQLVLRFSSFTGGGAGLSVATGPAGPQSISGIAWTYWVLLTVCIILFTLAVRVKVSRFGRSMVAIRDKEVVAATLSIDVRATKIAFYAISAAVAGIAGWMYAAVNLFVGPTSFALILSIDLVIAMIVGGSDSLVLGPVLGAAFLVYVPEAAPYIGLNALLTPLVFGVVLIALLRFMRSGAAGFLASIWRRVIQR